MDDKEKILLSDSKNNRVRGQDKVAKGCPGRKPLEELSPVEGKGCVRQPKGQRRVREGNYRPLLKPMRDNVRERKE